MACNECKKDKPIVNKKYNLCPDCNSIRLTGSSLQERQAESALKYQQKALDRFRQKVTDESDIFDNSLYHSRTNKGFQKVIPVKQRSPVRKQTSKDAKVKSALSDLKRSIELEAVQNNEYYCKGCGSSHVGLDKSHILSVGQFKQLELIKANIQLMCRKCHQIWESGAIEEQMRLHCFIDNVAFIYFYDLTQYNKFITRIESYQVFRIDQEKAGIDSILEKIKEGIDLAG